MDEHAAREFRRSRLDLLRFLASPAAQRQFEVDVPRYDGYAYSEFVSWWGDDFHPDSLLFRAAFTIQEISFLSAFNATFEHALLTVDEAEPRVDTLLCLKEWQDVIAAATETLGQIACEP